MATEIDWNVIELTEIYESFDLVLRLLDEDFQRARRIVDAAIKHGADAESMTQPIDEFAIELHIFCNAINSRTEEKPNNNQTS